MPLATFQGCVGQVLTPGLIAGQVFTPGLIAICDADHLWLGNTTPGCQMFTLLSSKCKRSCATYTRLTFKWHRKRNQSRFLTQSLTLGFSCHKMQLSPFVAFWQIFHIELTTKSHYHWLLSDKKDSVKREHQPVSRLPSQTPPDSPSHYFPLAASPLPLAGGIRLNKHLHHHPPPLPPLSPPSHQLQSLWSPQVSSYPLPTPSSIQILHSLHSKRTISMTVGALKLIHQKIPLLS